MASSLHVVVDSSVVINFLTDGAADEHDNPEWFDHSKWVFEEHERTAHHIVVPAIAIAEIAGNGKVRGSHIPKRDRHRRIQRIKEWILAAKF